MNPNDSFDQRRRSLEDEFFYNRDQQLVAKLRNELEAMEDKLQLSHVSGILDEKTLLDLAQSGVTAESLLAMRMVPMLVVAWSDNVITSAERAAILKAAAHDNIAPGTAAYKLLEQWLQDRPSPQVVQAWREYIRELVKVAKPELVQELKARTSRLCHQVALASNSFWSLGRISADKQRVIDDLLAAWDADGGTPHSA